MFDSNSGRAGGFAAAANMTPEQRTARAVKARAARTLKEAAIYEARQKHAAKITRKMQKRGFSTEQITKELDTLGLGPRKPSQSPLLPSDADLEPIYADVDARWPGLTSEARRKQALFLLRSTSARRPTPPPKRSTS